MFSISFSITTPENPESKLYIAFTYPYTYTCLQSDLNEITDRVQKFDDKIYFIREHVCDTVCKRQIDLLTISSLDGILDEREPRLTNLFLNCNQLRPYKFSSEKRVIFLTGRVHPGEVPSSHMLKGIIDLLINESHPLAKLLRQFYVFKIIPMLNPDGVVVGNFRNDTLGQNLNRFYHNPTLEFQPAIYAVRNLIQYYNNDFNGN